MSPSILITGATGTIGSQLLSILQAKGLEAAAMTSRPGHTIPGFRTVQGDFAKPETLVAAFQGFDTVFLLQPLAPEMVAFGLNAVAAAQAAGVKRIMRVSGGGADSASPFSLLRVHGTVDDAVRASGLEWTLLRPSAFMQNHLTYNMGAIRGGAFYAPHGEGASALIDVRDIAEVAALVLANAAAHQGQVYDLTGAESLSDAEQMAILAEAIGRPVAYVDVPEAAAAEAMAGMGFPALLVDWLMSLNALIKAGYAAGQSPAFERLTGKAPRTFAAFVQEHRALWC